MFNKLISRLEVGLSRLLRRLRLRYYHFRLGGTMLYLENEGEFIGPACPHEVRIPMEAVRRLTDHQRRMLDNALVLSGRPYGVTLHVCRRCYSLTKSTIKATYLGY